VGKKKLPRPIERRHLIERELSTDHALRYAEAYLEEGFEVDAIAFLVKAEATDRLVALRGRAIEVGDGFLLRAVAAAMADPPKTEEWEALAEAAKRAGKERYSTDALRHAERGES
jgi:hypothetical protein